MGGDGSTEVVTVGLRNKLTCTWNFTVIPEKTVDDIQLDEFDALAIPGGFEEAGFIGMHTVEILTCYSTFLCQAEAYCQYLCCIINAWKSGILVGKKLPHTVIQRVNEKSS